MNFDCEVCGDIGTLLLEDAELEPELDDHSPVIHCTTCNAAFALNLSLKPICTCHDVVINHETGLAFSECGVHGRKRHNVAEHFKAIGSG